MIHGLRRRLHMELLAIRLASQFRVAALDLRGHGDFEWDPEARYDTATFAGDLTKAVAALGFERMILIGHSLGADVAIRFAAAQPSRVAALIIVNFGPELQKKGFTRSCGTSPQAQASRLLKNIPNGLSTTSVGRPGRAATIRSGMLAPVRRDWWGPKADAALATSSEISKFVASDGRYCNPELWPMPAGSVAPPWSSGEAAPEFCLSMWRIGWSSARFGTVSLRLFPPPDTP